MLEKWENLPECMRNDEVKKYYMRLKEKENSLFIKRLFDIWMSVFLLLLLAPVLIATAVMIKLDSPGPVIFRQTRVTAYNRDFTIYKFRSMVHNAAALGSSVTVSNDSRITNMGRLMRKYRIDELPQLINVLKGDMSFVGTRPEVRKYVDAYTSEMMATLLMPAGITSNASIMYRDEDELLSDSGNADKTYIDIILPAKMEYNLRSIKRFSLVSDVITMIRTVLAVL
ncbi:MAG: sugar transferase [Lachnospiraceae bacterium]|nr:sugar transferase [Lachnospiraceae bacterium]